MDLEGKIVELLDKVQTAAPKIGAKAVEYGLADTFYSGLGSLLGGFVALLLAIYGVRAVRREWKRVVTDCPQADLTDTDPGRILPGFFLSLIGGSIALCILVDIWNWVAVFDTEKALAHRILERVIG